MKTDSGILLGISVTCCEKETGKGKFIKEEFILAQSQRHNSISWQLESAGHVASAVRKQDN